VTERENLRQRRELVLLAAELQRANITRRLERIETNPTRRVLGLFGTVAANPAMTRIGAALAALALRTYRKKRLQQSYRRSTA
jgi:hypothetical protein